MVRYLRQYRERLSPRELQCRSIFKVVIDFKLIDIKHRFVACHGMDRTFT